MNWRWRWKYLAVWMGALAAAFALLPRASARHFTAWRFDGSAVHTTTAGTQATNTGFNPFERFSDPTAREFGLYWRSSDKVEFGPLPAAPARVWPPVVVELASPGNEDNLFDHLIIVPRGTELAAYHPGTATGLGNLDAITRELAPTLTGGWTLDLTALPDVPDGTAGVTAPVIAAATGVTVGNRTELWRFLYVVIGAGTAGDPARVFCLRLNVSNPEDLPVDDPDLPAGDPARPFVRWSHPVTGAGGGSVPVVGMAFADIGTPALPEPLLFVTTEDGELIALNAAPDGAVTERWRWSMPAPPVPAFGPGAAPAVSRVTLAAPALPVDTIGKALTNGVSEYLVFVNGNDGFVRAFEAGGKPKSGGGFDPNERWSFQPDGDPVTPGVETEQFAVPPLVWNPATPIRNGEGLLVSVTQDFGFDDVVVVAAQSGNVYGIDAQGEIQGPAAGADEGKPSGATFLRWRYPEIRPLPAFGLDPAREDDPWPRQNDVARTPIADWTIRSPLAASAGRNADPDADEPNTIISDDYVFARFDQPVLALPGDPPGYQRFFEWVGGLHPYGFVEVSQPIRLKQNAPPPIPLLPTSEPPVEQLEVRHVAPAFDVPPEFVRVGRRKGAADDQPLQAVYITRQQWIEDDGTVRQVNFGDTLEVTYLRGDVPVGDPNERQTDTVVFPSRRDPGNINNSQRASLGQGAARLQEVIGGVDEGPCLLTDTEFNNGLRPAMSVVPGSASNGVIYVGSQYRGRVIILNFTPALLLRLNHSTDPPAPPPALDALDDVQLASPRPVLGVALTDNWAYVVYTNGHLRAYGNGLGPSGSTFLPP
ncbi:MAG: hypothetical protein HY320_04450, partial [Armatimonadetes bacterium]|nr:hypothetical protein [Armatimonadota bacterium]